MEVVDDDDKDATGRVAARPVRRQDQAVAARRRWREHVVLAATMDHRQRDDLLFDAVLVDLELAVLEVGDELTSCVADDGVRPHEIDARRERRCLVLSRRYLDRADRHQDGCCDSHSHKTYMLSGWLKRSPSRAMAAPRPAIW